MMHSNRKPQHQDRFGLKGPFKAIQSSARVVSRDVSWSRVSAQAVVVKGLSAAAVGSWAAWGASASAYRRLQPSPLFWKGV